MNDTEPKHYCIDCENAYPLYGSRILALCKLTMQGIKIVKNFHLDSCPLDKKIEK